MPEAWCDRIIQGEVIMAKANKVAQTSTTNVDFNSLKDMAYQQAGVGDSLESMAKYALAKIKGFPKDVDEESKAQLYSGYRLRYQENNPAVEYVRVNGHYEPATPESGKAIERMTLSVDHAFSYTQQQFGQLKAQDNAKYELIKPLREKVNVYCSNRLGDLKRKANQLTAPKRERKPTADFDHAINDWLDAMRTRCLNASKRGDATADKEKFSRAVTAFKVEWNKA